MIEMVKGRLGRKRLVGGALKRAIQRVKRHEVVNKSPEGFLLSRKLRRHGLVSRKSILSGRVPAGTRLKLKTDGSRSALYSVCEWIGVQGKNAFFLTPRVRKGSGIMTMWEEVSVVATSIVSMQTYR